MASAKRMDAESVEKRRIADAAYKERNKEKIRAKAAAWRAANPERVKELKAAHHAKNREAINKKAATYSKDHYLKNSAEIKEKQRARYLAAPEIKIGRAKEWRERNPERSKVNSARLNRINRSQRTLNEANRRARKLKAGGRLSAGIVEKLLKIQKGLCACCGKPLGLAFHLDHIMPLALGGENSDANMQILRSVCNLQKSARHPVEFMRSRGFLI